MKKVLLLPVLFAAVFLVWNTACQKDTQTDPSVSATTENPVLEDRALQPYNPCGNRQTVFANQLASHGALPADAFRLGWKYGELDRIANDCVLGGSLPGNCSNSGTAYFSGIPSLNFANFMDANGYVTPQKQDQIIAIALAHATSHITNCGEGTSPKVYQIDFVIPNDPPFTFDFAVRYSCCPSTNG